jgi:hypothetical protein
MRNALILIALIVVLCVGLGFYLGWFNLSSRNDEGKSDFTLSVDSAKIEADKDKALGKLKDVGHQALDKIPAATEKGQD